jgi:hypothetical protein
LHVTLPHPSTRLPHSCGQAEGEVVHRTIRLSHPIPPLPCIHHPSLTLITPSPPSQTMAPMEKGFSWSNIAVGESNLPCLPKRRPFGHSKIILTLLLKSGATMNMVNHPSSIPFCMIFLHLTFRLSVRLCSSSSIPTPRLLTSSPYF